MSEPLVLDVWADVACPWCWIGHRRLAAALDGEPEGAVVVRHRAYELQPGLPPEGLGREFYVEKFGGEDAMRAAFGHVASEGESAGIGFRFDLVQRAPNTALAHRAVKVAEEVGLGMEVLEALFAAHFAEGRDVSDRDVVVEVAASAGMSAEGLRVALDLGAGAKEVHEDEATALKLGVRGVPFFLAGAAVAVSGAHPPEVLRELVAAARQRLAAG